MENRSMSEQFWEDEDIKTEICNEYCRFPREIAEEEELYKKCEVCPLNLL